MKHALVSVTESNVKSCYYPNHVDELTKPEYDEDVEVMVELGYKKNAIGTGRFVCWAEKIDGFPRIPRMELDVWTDPRNGHTVQAVHWVR